MCAASPAGRGDAHHVVKRDNADVLYIEMGDRSGGDRVRYLDDDIDAATAADGSRRFNRKSGTPY